MQAGDVVGARFVLEAKRGSGGMGTVWRAVDRTTGEPVALKFLDTDATERFEREAALLAELAHPSIVRYVAHGRAGQGTPFLAMEWLEGESLRSKLVRGGLTTGETLVLGRRLAEALGAAHVAGIVHRDVKPSNVILAGGKAEECKLIDFGIARLAATNADVKSLTRAGDLIGTPRYMAPEQARGERDVGPAADVFSLGCVLYECLVRRPAFSGEGVLAILTKVLFEEVAPPSESAGVPPELSEIVLRMMSKDPATRPADGRAAAAELHACEPTRMSAAPSAPPVALGKKELRLVSVIVTGESEAEAPTLVGTSAPSPEALRVERLVGGGRVAVLTSEGVATDVARQAVRAALSLASSDVAVVVATGRAMVGSRLPVGEVIDRAAGLLESAKREGVRLDEATAALAGGRFELRGDAEGLYAIRERAVEEPVRTLMGRPTPCLGREREIEMLMALLDACIEEPRATCALLTAQAGIGKSRLLSEWLGRVRVERKDVEVWIGRGEQVGAGSAFALAGQMLRRAAGAALGEPPEQAQAKMLARTSRSVPESERRRVAAFLGEIAGVKFRAEDSSLLYHARQDGQRMSDQTFAAWLDFVEAELGSRPLLLVLEDLHWGDAPTVRLCEAALRVCGEQPLMVLALGRPEVREVFPKIFEERNPTSIALAPLGKRACEAFVRNVLGETENAVVSKIFELAQGSALLLEELVRAHAEGRGGEAPESVLAIVGARLALLPEPARRVLRAASVFGTPFWTGAVSSLLGGAVGTTEAESLMERLVEKDVVVRRTESRFAGEKEYAFRHALVREAAYRTLVDADRELGHKLAGEWLEQTGGRDAAAGAEHFEKARDLPRARGWWKRAAEDAYDGNDLDATLTRAERAIACGAEGEALGLLRLLQAQAHNFRGERAEQRQRAREALANLPEDAEPFFEALGVLCAACQRAGDAEGALRAAERLLAARPTEAGGVAAQGVGAAFVSTSLRLLGRPAEADALLSMAEDAFALKPGDRRLAARLHHARGSAAKFRGTGRYLGQMREARAAWADLGDTKQLANMQVSLGDAWMHLGRYAEAEGVLREAVAAATRFGLHPIAGLARHNLGFVLARAGRLREAREMGEQGLAECVRGGDQHFVRAGRAYLADTLRRQGELEAAEEQARGALEGAEQNSARARAATALAEILLARGAAAEALSACLPALEILREQGMDEGAARLRLVHAEALLGMGDTALAVEALGEARERILEAAQKLEEPDLRQSFLENVEEHARTLALARKYRVIAALR